MKNTDSDTDLFENIKMENISEAEVIRIDDNIKQYFSQVKKDTFKNYVYMYHPEFKADPVNLLVTNTDGEELIVKEDYDLVDGFICFKADFEFPMVVAYAINNSFDNEELMKQLAKIGNLGNLQQPGQITNYPGQTYTNPNIIYQTIDKNGSVIGKIYPTSNGDFINNTITGISGLNNTASIAGTVLTTGAANLL